MPLAWHGDEFRAALEKTMARRIAAACMRLSAEVKADISQSGTVRYAPPKKDGTPGKRQKTIYNVSHSRPGNPPFKQTGELRRSITWESEGLVGRVGSNLKKALALELGTVHMAPRPFLRANLIRHTGTITRIICGTIKPGELPEIRSNQFRSGHLGAGAAEAGYE